MKTKAIVIFISIYLMNCTSNLVKISNKSLNSVIQNDDYKKYSSIIAKTRKEAYKKFISKKIIKNTDKILFIEELDLFSNRIWGEIIYSNGNIVYEKNLKNDDLYYSQNKITSVAIIKAYIEKNQINELIEFSKNKKNDDASWIFVTVYDKKIAKSYMFFSFGME